MLERLTEDHLARRRRRPRPAVLLSVAAHAAAIAGLLVLARWQIDKLETSEPPVLLAGFALPAPSGADEPAAEVKKKPRSGRRVVRERVQPSAQTEAPESQPGDEQDGTGPTDGPPLQFCAPGQQCGSDVFAGVSEPVCGDGRTEGREQCDDGGRVSGDGCSASCNREVAQVQSRLIEGSRIAGDPQIPPPPSVHAAMVDRHQAQVKGTVKMCLDRDGAVQSLRVLESTGHPLYDELLTSRMRSWRYQPYKLASGVAVPVCTSVTFIYRIR
jgi:TonB family protein